MGRFGHTYIIRANLPSVSFFFYHQQVMLSTYILFFIVVKRDKNGCSVKAKSMKKSEDSHKLELKSLSDGPQIDVFKCSCKVGQGTCNHKAALLFLAAHYKALRLKLSSTSSTESVASLSLQ